MDKVDITIIGAGVIGLAISYELSRKFPDRDIVVIERNDSFGRETSSRNSEVIHAGLYYPAGSLKAETCIKGKEMVYRFCRENNIPHKKTGKILVAVNAEEEVKIEAIYKNAETCGLRGLKFLTKAEIKKLEPSVDCLKGFLSPDTGILDTHAFMKALHDNSRAVFVFGSDLEAIDKRSWVSATGCTKRMTRVRGCSSLWRHFSPTRTREAKIFSLRRKNLKKKLWRNSARQKKYSRTSIFIRVLFIRVWTFRNTSSLLFLPSAVFPAGPRGCWNTWRITAFLGPVRCTQARLIGNTHHLINGRRVLNKFRKKFLYLFTRGKFVEVT
ncbi:MAG: FAD-dependent oxidoreductase [Candidatus Omnitrophica bacterium]|nr:FAD-dependent oxidoreductase [Candidatus Omnitrophota bacterium]